MEQNVAVIGNADFVMPFSALGLDTYAVDDTPSIIESARRIIEKEYALVVIAENIAQITEEFFSGQADSPIPCVVVVPFTSESQGFATEALEKVLKMAIGIDILQNN